MNILALNIDTLNAGGCATHALLIFTEVKKTT